MTDPILQLKVKFDWINSTNYSKSSHLHNLKIITFYIQIKNSDLENPLAPSFRELSKILAAVLYPPF